MNEQAVVLEAIEELARRGSRLSMMVAVPCITVAVLLGVPGYLVIRELQFMTMEMASPYLSGIVGFGVPVVIALFVAKTTSRILVRSRRPSWIAEMSLRHRVDKSVLEEAFGDWL